MINVIAGNDFRLIVTAKKSVGVSVGVLDLTEVDDLRIYLTRAGRSKMSQSYALDDYGRAIVYVNARDVAVGVYGIELMGVMGGSNLRAHKTNVLTVSGHGHGNEGVLLDYEVDIVFSVNVPTTDAYVQAAIEAHNEDENAHPELQTKIADKVDDILVEGESVVETDPITGKRTVGFRKDQFGKVDDVLVNGRSVVGEGGVARIDSQDFKGERGNGITFIDVEESQVDEGDNIVHIHCTDDENVEGTTFNVKNGKRGNGIASVTEQTSSEDGGINTHTIHYADPNVPDSVIHTRNGRRGRPGADFQPIEDMSGLHVAQSLGNDETKVISQKAVTEELAGYVKMSFTIDDLEEHGIENNTIGEAIQINTSSSFTNYHHGLYPVVAGQHGKITTIAGTSLLLAYCFMDANNIVLAKSSTDQTHENEDFVVPEGAAYIGVNFKENSQDIAFSLQLYGVEKNINDIEEALEEVDDIKADVQGMKNILDPQPTTYEASDLEVGNVDCSPVGSTYSMGGLSDFKHIIIPCVEGQSVNVTTSGSTKSTTKIRGIAFANANNVVLQTSPVGAVSGVFPAPKNSAYCIVNCTEAALDTFSMEVTPAPTWMDELKKDVQDLRDDVDDLMNESEEEEIPLYHGKDMFFIKDTPLDFYAQSVLFKNYPKYKGVYVNCAQDLSRRNTSDFSVPVITHVCPTGKVYFKDGDIVGIYADDGKLYKDSWNAVTGITAHTTDLTTKQKSIKALFFGSSTTEYGLATYVKNYLNTLGVTVTCIGHKNDNLGTPSEGYAGWSNEMICGQKKTSSSAAISTSQFIRLATAEDKENYPDYCFKYSTSKVEGTSYTDASDKTGDFYIFDFAWFLEHNSLETPDVVFFLLGINGDVDKYGTYMSWIVDRIMQACPNCKIGINVAQAIRLQSDADEKIESNRQKFDMLYQYVAEKNNPNLKIVSCHCYQSPYFSHKFASEEGENTVTTKVTMDMESDGGYLHMRNSGYQEIAKAIGAYIAYCLPDAQ